MKKKLILVCLILLMGILMPYNAKAQEATNNVTLAIDGSALLGIETGSSIALSLGGATVAGAAVQDIAADTTARLRISSMVSGTALRTITAELTTEMAASNTELLVKLLTPNSNFTFPGNMGTLTGTAGLLTVGSAITLATGIGTCWSGTAADDGYPLAYTFQRKSGATSFTTPGLIIVKYTLTAAL